MPPEKAMRREIRKAGFVTEGAIIVRTLGLEGMASPIPEGESGIIALRAAPNGRIYGLTHGTRSHLFVYDPFPTEDFVIDLGVVGENTTGGDIFCAGDGLVYGIVFGGRDSSTVQTSVFRYDPSGDYVGLEHGMWTAAPEMLSWPLEGSRVSKLAFDSDTGLAYGLLLPGNVLFSYRGESGELAKLAQVEGRVVPPVVCVADGVVYGVGEWGVVFRYDPEAGEIERTDMVIPAGKGKDYVNEASALVYDDVSRTIYGGTSVDGYLFFIDLESEEVVCCGKPTDQPYVRCLTVGLDGRVYGVVGQPKRGMCHLVRYDPRNGDLRDLGIPFGTVTEHWVAHEIDAICTSRNGHIVLGENDRISHLMVYCPAVERRR